MRPAQIDTLRSLLTDKETHLRHIMEVMERQDEANSLLVNHLPEVSRRATRVRTVRKKKSGLAGFFGGKKTVQVLPSAGELHAFSDSLTALQRKQAAEMEAYADSLRIRNRTLNRELGRLIRDLDTQAQAAFDAREQDISEAPSYCCSSPVLPSTGKSGVTTTNGNSVSNSSESCRRAITQMKS